MRVPLIFLFVAVLVAMSGSQVHAQAFPNDNDGLLDVGEAPGFPVDPAAATGVVFVLAGCGAWAKRRFV